MKLYTNSAFLEHETGNHPENVSRLQAFQGMKSTPASDGYKLVKTVHEFDYVDAVALCAEKQVRLSDDTPLSSKSFDAACLAAGLSVKASQDNAFALVRPPGHHAFAGYGHGFCLFNNVAIASLFQARQGKRVFVLDFDLHHGDGTESLLRGKLNVFYASLHQHSIFPGTGMKSFDNVLNVPLAGGTRDTQYIAALEKKIVPALKQFKPDLIALSAGFDGYYKDQNWLGEGIGFALTKRSYEFIREMVAPFPNFSVLEGGYHPDSVKEGVSVFVPFEEWV